MELTKGVVTDGFTSSDKRAHERFRINLKAYIRLSDASVIHAQAIDISMGGIYIEYGAPADEDKEFEITFDLPFTTEFRRVLVRARVVRSIVIGNRGVYGLAFVFTEFIKESEEILEKYISLRKQMVS